MNIQGQIIFISNEIVNGNFRKREFVVRTVETYSQEIKFEIQKEKADAFVSNFKVGDNIDVEFNLNGRSWFNKKTNENVWFNSIVAWRVSIFNNGNNNIEALQPSENTPQSQPNVNVGNNEPDDLPF